MNGKIVDIKNIEIFEKAAEGMAINRVITNTIPNDKLELDFSKIEKLIDLYKSFYRSLPFPLYGIDDDLKYCAAGLFIKKESQDTTLRMWVDSGLYISVDDEKGLVLGFINNSWGILAADTIKEDNLNIQSYYEAVGFEEYVWILANLFKGESTAAYYRTFMPKFVEACNNQALVLKWELSNILLFSPVPDKTRLYTNEIIDLDNNKKYTMDIFIAGTRPTKESQHVWSLTDDEPMQPAIRPKFIKVYGYDLYEKPIVTEDAAIKPGEDKLKPVELFGVNSLFCTLCNIKNTAELAEFDSYKGFIADNNLVFEVDSRIFVAKSNKYIEPKEVARGVEIYAYKQNIVYFLKSRQLGYGVKKETIYSYSLSDGNLRLCRIQFGKA